MDSKHGSLILQSEPIFINPPCLLHHFKAGLKFAKDHVKNDEFWKNIWSDETKIDLFSPNDMSHI